MSPSRPFLVLRLAACLLVLVALPASCFSDVNSGPGAMCDRLDRCFGENFFTDCTSTVDGLLDRSTDELQTAWLSAFDTRNCADSCKGALECSGLAPICTPLGAGCLQDERCCGNAAGIATCEGADIEIDQEGKCCGQRGTLCEDTADCCDNEECVDFNGQNRCGGVICIVNGLPCESNGDCCDGRCSGESICISDTCLVDNGAPGCESEGIACCDGFVCQGDKCTVPQCAAEGEACIVADDCCGDAACDVQGECKAICSDTGDPCDSAADCCGLGGVTCNPTDGICRTAECEGPGEACGSDAECCGDCGASQLCCSNIGGGCNSPVDCCGNGARCEQVGENANPRCCNRLVGSVANPQDPCVENPLPLDLAILDHGCSEGKRQMVCTLHPECCCDAWGPQCVLAWASLCNDFNCDIPKPQ